MQAELPGDRLLLLQLVGSFVLLLDGTTPPRSVQLADEVWKSLDAETESTVILFDSAKKTDSVVSQKQITAALALHAAFPDQLFQVCLDGKLRDPLESR